MLKTRKPKKNNDEKSDTKKLNFERRIICSKEIILLLMVITLKLDSIEGEDWEGMWSIWAQFYWTEKLSANGSINWPSVRKTDENRDGRLRIDTHYV